MKISNKRKSFFQQPPCRSWLDVDGLILSASHTQAPPLAERGAAGVSIALYSSYRLDVVTSDACRQRFRNSAKKRSFIEALSINELKHQGR